MTRRRALRYCLWGWAIIASAAATIGAVTGWIGVENDRT